MKITMKTVNRELAPLEVELVAGRGYFYFMGIGSLKEAGQIGDSVPVYRLNRQALSTWILDAKAAIAEHKARHAYTKANVRSLVLSGKFTVIDLVDGRAVHPNDIPDPEAP